MDKQKVVYPYNEMLFGYKKEKEWNTDTYYNLDESWKHYAKLNKPVTKDPILFNSIHIKCSL